MGNIVTPAFYNFDSRNGRLVSKNTPRHKIITTVTDSRSIRKYDVFQGKDLCVDHFIFRDYNTMNKFKLKKFRLQELQLDFYNNSGRYFHFDFFNLKMIDYFLQVMGISDVDELSQYNHKTKIMGCYRENNNAGLFLDAMWVPSPPGLSLNIPDRKKKRSSNSGPQEIGERHHPEMIMDYFGRDLDDALIDLYRGKLDDLHKR